MLGFVQLPAPQAAYFLYAGVHDLREAARGGQGFQINVDTDSAQREQNSGVIVDSFRVTGIAVTMPCRHGGHNNGDEELLLRSTSALNLCAVLTAQHGFPCDRVLMKEI